MIDHTTTYTVELGFLPPDAAIPDPEHPGLLRAGDRATAPYGREGVEVHHCLATDLLQSPSSDVDLLGAGFDTVDLAPLTELQSVFSRVREAQTITDTDAAAIRAALDGAVLQCASGVTLTVLHIADEGMFMRTAGPNRMALVPDHSNGMNDHGPATSVHADQDVFGTPMRQLMEGRAPTLFRHDSPDGHNRDASLMMLNLWIPLEQVTRPLALMDASSLDRRAHQLRYGLVTDGILQRDSSRRINDIWVFRHHESQRWYFTSEIDANTAYVFSTLSTPHGSIVLPGEDRAEARYRQLTAAVDAVRRRDEPAALSCLQGAEVGPVGEPATAPLRRAIAAMEALLEEGRAHLPALCRGEGAEGWCTRAEAAAERVVRKSLEMRAVALLLPARRS